MKERNLNRKYINENSVPENHQNPKKTYEKTVRLSRKNRDFVELKQRELEMGPNEAINHIIKMYMYQTTLRVTI
jgi:hypothetical protein